MPSPYRTAVSGGGNLSAYQSPPSEMKGKGGKKGRVQRKRFKKREGMSWQK